MAIDQIYSSEHNALTSAADSGPNLSSNVVNCTHQNDLPLRTELQ